MPIIFEAAFIHRNGKPVLVAWLIILIAGLVVTVIYG
jgi:hypothetical protein